ncbi:hypothetical protein [Streptomyces olivaceus]|uniref:hypothetical protein n=1 Tax=Streptomyces olivaceus TaxID=47716 RepID=UPI004055AA8F
MRHHLTDAALAHIALDANVRHVPAWLYVQDQGDGTVSFVGSSRVPGGGAHPLRYGSDRTHQFLVGELLVRPHYALDTNVLRGQGLGGLVTQHPDLGRFLQDGEILLNPHGLCPVTPR